MNAITNFFYYLLTPLRLLSQYGSYALSGPRRLWGISLPARVAWITFFALIIISTLALVIQANRLGMARSEHFWRDIWICLVLLILIPLFVYQALKLWLQPIASRYPDIDKAWHEGVTALAQNGLLLDELPLFLILGVPDRSAADTLISATNLKMIVPGIPSAKAPLHWYALEEPRSGHHYILLACSEVGSLSKLVGRSRGGGAAAAQPQSRDAVTGTRRAGGITGTLVVGGGEPIAAAAAADSVRSSSVAPMVADQLRGTLTLGDTIRPGNGGDPRAEEWSGNRKPLDNQDFDEQKGRLQHLADLIRHARQPVCPLNGVLAVLPYPVFKNIVAKQDMPRAVREDLETIHRASQLYYPVTAMVTGMEAETGFSELVRRVGLDKAKTFRFGKGLEVGTAPVEETVEALSSHACGAFEDWVYQLFREPESLTKTGNAKLYRLLCNVRSELQPRLTDVLIKGFSCTTKTDFPKILSGCYFAATGETEDRQAFIKSTIVERLFKLDEDVLWTDEAQHADRRYHRLAQAGLLWSGLMMMAIAALLIWNWATPDVKGNKDPKPKTRRAATASLAPEIKYGSYPRSVQIVAKKMCVDSPIYRLPLQWHPTARAAPSGLIRSIQRTERRVQNIGSILAGTDYDSTVPASG